MEKVMYESSANGELNISVSLIDDSELGNDEKLLYLFLLRGWDNVQKSIKIELNKLLDSVGWYMSKFQKVIKNLEIKKYVSDIKFNKEKINQEEVTFLQCYIYQNK